MTVCHAGLQGNNNRIYTVSAPVDIVRQQVLLDTFWTNVERVEAGLGLGELLMLTLQVCVVLPLQLHLVLKVSLHQAVLFATALLGRQGGGGEKGRSRVCKVGKKRVCSVGGQGELGGGGGRAGRECVL